MLDRSVVSWLLGFTLFSGTAVAQPTAESEPPPNLPPKIAEALPANLAGALLIDTTETWRALEPFNPLPFQIAGPGAIPLLPMEADFQTDIAPWVGKWAATVLLPARDPYGLELTDFKTSVLTIVSVENTARMNGYIEKMETLRGEPPIEREFEGTKIWEWEAGEFPTLEFPEPSSPLPGLPGDMGMKVGIKAGIKELPDRLGNWFQGQLLAQSKPKPKPRVQPIPPVLPPIPEAPPPVELEPFPEPMEPFPEPSEFPPFPIPRPGLAMAFLPDGYLAVSTDAVALEQLIAAQKDLVPLSANPQFQQTFEHPEFGRSLVALYGNLKQLSQLASTLNIPNFPTVPTEPASANFLAAILEPMVKEYTTLHAWGWGAENGLRTQSIAYYRNPSPERATVVPANGTQMLSRIPGSSYFSLNSFNFARQWQRIVETTQDDPDVKTGLEQLGRVVWENLNLDLEQDLIPLFDGEYALFLFPTKEGLLPFYNPGFEMGVGIAIETSNRPGMERVLTQLETWIESFSDNVVEVSTTEVQGMAVTSWNNSFVDESQASQIAYGWSDANTLVITTGSGPMAQLLPQPYGTLDRSYTFQTAIESFAVPNDGYFFLNMGSILSFVNTFFAPLAGESPDSGWIRTAMGVVRSLSISSFTTAELEQADLSLVLSPATEKLDLGLEGE